MAKIKTRLTMGGVLSAAGLWLRAAQICLMAFGIKAAVNSTVTLIVTSIAVGGLCVLASELKGRGAVFALLSAVFMLCGVMSAGSLRLLGSASMILTFVFFILLLCTMPRDGVQFWFVILVTALSASVLWMLISSYSLPTAVMSVVLAIIYILTGAGLIL